ncbi:MAG: hypothetical protein K8R88_10690 [Armatimonadetes bacterium]|nr:hypothetical protein [Armatimonadota bacterium]
MRSILFCTFGVVAVTSHATIFINFDSQVNGNITTYTGGGGYPQNGGTVSIAGIDHQLARTSTGKSGSMVFGGTTNIIPIGQFGVKEIYTLINSGFGTNGQLNGRIEAHGSGGLLQTFLLTQGDNIRDHYNGNYNNSAPNVNGTLSYSTGVRFDQQKMVLSSAFHTATLTELRFIGQNNGGSNGNPFLQALSLELVQPTNVISGQVTLSAWAQATAGRTVEFKVYNGMTEVLSATGTLSSDGSFSFAHSLADGNYSLIMNANRGWLKKKVSITIASTASVDNNAILLNGDVVDDGVVDLSDYTSVAVAFNAQPADSNWNALADVNGDLIVDLTDYTEIAVNFNAIDDSP